MEELTTAQMKEQATRSLRAIGVSVATTLGIFAHGPRKGTKMMAVHLDRPGPYQ